MLDGSEISAAIRSTQAAFPALMRRRHWRGGDAGSSFEQVFPAYEFSELVRLGVAFAHLVVRLQRRARLSGALDKHLPNPCKPAPSPCAPEPII
jgi:hypothetical protein